MEGNTNIDELMEMLRQQNGGMAAAVPPGNSSSLNLDAINQQLSRRSETLDESWRLKIGTRESVWAGTAAPDEAWLCQALNPDVPASDLTSAAATVIRSAPEAHVVPLLKHLSACYVTGGDATTLDSILETTKGKRAICGKVRLHLYIHIHALTSHITHHTHIIYIPYTHHTRCPAL